MKELALIVWMVISLMFVLSGVGLLLFVPRTIYWDIPNEPSTWMKIGLDLLDAVKHRGER